jgi:hypothetical protein
MALESEQFIAEKELKKEMIFKRVSKDPKL